jgi:Protein of unknown function (DUF1236)
MKAILTAIPLAALLFIGSMAAAQAPVQKELPPPARTINLTLEQRHIIKEFLKDSKVDKAPDGLNVGVGDELPEKVALHDMPAEVGQKVPQVKTHKFVVIASKVLLIDPKDRKIAEVIE